MGLKIKIKYNYKPNEKRDVERPVLYWKNKQTFQEDE